MANAEPLAGKLAEVLSRSWWVLLTRGIAIRQRKEIDNEWRLVLAGLASVAFGLFLAARPGAGALAALWLIAAFSFVFGILFIILALRVKGVARQIEARLTR